MYEVQQALLALAVAVLLTMAVLCCALQVQQILLVADKALNGSFTLSFNGAVTAPLDAQALHQP